MPATIFKCKDLSVLARLCVQESLCKGFSVENTVSRKISVCKPLLCADVSLAESCERDGVKFPCAKTAVRKLLPLCDGFAM